jgi:hypothetical protein
MPKLIYGHTRIIIINIIIHKYLLMFEKFFGKFGSISGFLNIGTQLEPSKILKLEFSLGISSY